jgi:hypothetical protein
MRSSTSPTPIPINPCCVVSTRYAASAMRGPGVDRFRFEPERWFEVDDERVLVFVRVTATGQGSGAAVEVRNAREFTIRDGLIVRFKVHPDRSAALKAVGLSENAPMAEG